MTTNSDPVNSSDEAIEVALAACNAPDVLDLRDALTKAFPIFAAAVRAEPVADERRRAVQQVRHDMELLADRVEDYTPEGVRIRLRNYAAQLEHSLAAGSVPVATPERLGNLSDAPKIVALLGEVRASHAREAARLNAPESYCHRCKGRNCSWAAPSPLWNKVMRGGDINGPQQFDEIICPVCFAELAEAAGIATGWRFYATDVSAEAETVTPSGRVWDETSWLWREPGESAQLDYFGDVIQTLRSAQAERDVLQQRIDKALETIADWEHVNDPDNFWARSVRAAVTGAGDQPIEETP